MIILKIVIVAVMCLSSFSLGFLHKKYTDNDFYKNTGNLDARVEITSNLQPLFGKMEKGHYENAIRIYDIKSTSVYAVKENGIMTIKITE